MDFFLQLFVNGISIGFLYGLSAMGFVMIFKSSSVLNFAHGEILAFGAFLFLASDAVLAVNRFRRPFRLAQAVILSSYFAGQLMISLSVGLRPVL